MFIIMHDEWGSGSGSKQSAERKVSWG